MFTPSIPHRPSLLTAEFYAIRCTYLGLQTQSKEVQNQPEFENIHGVPESWESRRHWTRTGRWQRSETWPFLVVDDGIASWPNVARFISGQNHENYVGKQAVC